MCLSWQGYYPNALLYERIISEVNQFKDVLVAAHSKRNLWRYHWRFYSSCCVTAMVFLMCTAWRSPGLVWEMTIVENMLSGRVAVFHLLSLVTQSLKCIQREICHKMSWTFRNCWGSIYESGLETGACHTLLCTQCLSHSANHNRWNVHFAFTSSPFGKQKDDLHVILDKKTK